MPRFLFAVGDSLFGVLDNFAARTLVFGADGAYLRSIDGRLYDHEVDDICVIGAERLLAMQLPRGELVRSDTGGAVYRQSRVRWPDPKLDSAIQLKQARFARQRTASPVCLLHTIRGKYFAEVNQENLELGEIFSYAEPIPVSEVIRNRGVIVGVKSNLISGSYAVITDTLLYVLYGGTSKTAERQVDAYSRQDYTYQWSIELPRTTAQFDIIGSRLMVLEFDTSDVARVSIYTLTNQPLAPRESKASGGGT